MSNTIDVQADILSEISEYLYDSAPQILKRQPALLNTIVKMMAAGQLDLNFHIQKTE